MGNQELLSPSEFSRLTEIGCVKIQNDLAGHIIQKDRVPLEEIKTVSGVDIAYWKDSEGAEQAVCCIVTVDVNNRAVIEKQWAAGRSEFPYIPGCLAFRELPLVVEAAAKLEKRPDVFMFDGNGILHTRGLGLASHASFYLDCPTVGVAKHLFRVDGAEFGEPEPEAGCCSDIVKDGAVIGRAVRLKRNVKPVYVSVGNYIDIDTATELVLKLVDDESHIPVPTRYADLETHIRRRELC